ncbi:hypothetical protein [Microbacterium sp.]|jgi:hypothetical protein|uniref:DUF7882 family protein n=1 Tax=Microbacterium sp. TaxID=51671 RepID=UPI0037CB58AF
MGHLFYGNTERPIDIPDRVLAHVKVVVATKLRRNESFTISWRHSDGAPRGRSTLWVHPSIPLRFVFETAEAEVLDRAYLHELALAAGSSGGMVVDLHLDPLPAEVRQLPAAATARDGARELAPAH